MRRVGSRTDAQSGRCGTRSQPTRRDRRLPERHDDRKKGGIWGYDGGKQVTGRTRHVATDTLGLLLTVAVIAADLADRERAKRIGEQVVGRFPRLVTICVDRGHSGPKLAAWYAEVGDRPATSRTGSDTPLATPLRRHLRAGGSV